MDSSRPPVNLVTGTRDGDLRLALTDGATGHPVDDLLPHDSALMHLVVVSPAGGLWHLHMIDVGPVTSRIADAPIWAHVHAMVPSRPDQPDQPDESVAAFGPDVPFTYTFPLPGRYLVWVQAERGYAVRTAPMTVEVPGGRS